LKLAGLSNDAKWFEKEIIKGVPTLNFKKRQPPHAADAIDKDGTGRW